MRRVKRRFTRIGAVVGAIALTTSGAVAALGSATAVARTVAVSPNKVGSLDCNGFKAIQRPVKLTSICTDPKGYDALPFYEHRDDNSHAERNVRSWPRPVGRGKEANWLQRLPWESSRRP